MIDEQLADLGITLLQGHFGMELARLRHQRGWSLEDLSRRTGYCPGWLGQLEEQERPPNWDALKTILRAYGLTLVIGYAE
jgi:transcriptional regulator with XRE-family HTH domain